VGWARVGQGSHLVQERSLHTVSVAVPPKPVAICFVDYKVLCSPMSLAAEWGRGGALKG
jgi:hypothetical protein